VAPHKILPFPSHAGEPSSPSARNAEPLLDQQETRYRGLLEAAPDAMVVVNTAGEIVLLNVQAEKQFGYRRDELIGQQITNVIPQGFAERLIADGTRSAAEALAQQIGTGIELSARRKDGSEFPIELMLSPLDSPDGILVTAAIRDISVRKQADKRLIESEDRYRLLLDGVQDHAIFMLDPRGLVISWNAGAQKIKGYTADQIIGQSFSCFFTAADIQRGRPQQVLQQTAAAGRHEEQVTRVRRDGSRFLAHVTMTALRDAAGYLRGFAEISHDLSANKAAEARYRALLEAAPDAMVVVNPKGVILVVNVQTEKQFGYRRDELLGRQVIEIIPEGFNERLISDGTRSAADALAQQIGTGIELSGKRRDGSRFPIELMLSPVQSVEGILVTAAIRDISMRKAAEAHLAQMESRYRGLLEAAPDAMVVVNPAGEIVLLNVQAEKQFGYRRDELAGQKITNIIPEGFEERLTADALRSTADALAQQIGSGIELSGRRKDGSRFPIELMLSPLQNADGVLVTAAIRNITARKAAEAHLLQKMEELKLSNEKLGQSAESAAAANRELEAFAYSVSHDLRAPLRSIDGFSQVLLEDYGEQLDAQGKDSLTRIRAASQRMGVLIDDMLALSQVTRRELAYERVDLSAMAAELIEELRLKQPLRRVEFICAPSLAATTDSHLIRIALANLLGNAWKFTGKRTHSRIEFGIADHQGKPAYFVRDNGAGFDMAYAGKLFGAFQRMHSVKEFEGTGIGLATVQRVLSRLGGRAWAEAALDQGATFHFFLDAGI
jgi:PAS domain S-box-containing protein